MEPNGPQKEMEGENDVSTSHSHHPDVCESRDSFTASVTPPRPSSALPEGVCPMLDTSPAPAGHHRRTSSSSVMETLRGRSAFLSGMSENSEIFLESPGAHGLAFPRISTLTLSGIWFLCALGCFLCFIVAELYQDFYPEFPLPFFLVLGSILSVVATATVYLNGRYKYGSHMYKFYQPFAGGQRFVVLQSFGVLCIAGGLVCSLVYMLTFEAGHGHSHGFLTTVAITIFFGNVMLFFSTRYFLIQERSRSGAATPLPQPIVDVQSPLLRMLSQRANAETAVVIALLFAQSAVSLITLPFPQLQSHIAHASFWISILTQITTHFRIASRYTKGYDQFIFRMRRGTDTVILWFLRLWCVCGFVMQVVQAWSSHGGPVPTTVFLGIEAFNVIGCGSFLFFLRTTSFDAVPDQALGSTIYEVGGLIAVLFSLALSAVSVGILYYMQSHKEVLDILLDNSSWTSGAVLRLTIGLILVVMLLLPVCVNTAGRMMHGERFFFFTSYTGKTALEVSLLQAAGFFTYIVFLFASMLYVWTGRNTVATVAVLANSTSVLFMVFAVRECSTLQARSLARSSPTSGEKTHAEDKPSGSDFRTYPTEVEEENYEMAVERNLSFIFNGKLLVSYLAALSSVMIRVVVDLSRQSIWGEITLPFERLINVANILFLITVPVAHYSAGDKGIRIFRPFSGSANFVVLQVLGWLLYGSGALVALLEMMWMPKHSTVFLAALNTLSSSQQPSDGSAPSPSAPSVGDIQQFHWFTLYGILQWIPLVLITISIVVETPRSTRAETQRRLARGAFFLLRKTLREQVAEMDEDAAAVVDGAFATLMDAALEGLNIPHTSRMLRLVAPPPSAGGAQKKASLSDSSDVDLDVDGSGEVDPFESVDELEDPLVARQRQQRHEGARVIVMLFCCASAAFFIIAAFVSNAGLFSLGFAVCGLILCTVSCIGVHAWYGMMVNGRTKDYSTFMPFKGGSVFMIRQIVGWFCYAAVLLVTLITAVESNEASGVTMTLASVLSVLSQTFILESIPAFLAHSGKHSFLEENGDGVVAVLTFFGAVAFGRMYYALCTFFSSSDAPAGSGADGGSLLSRQKRVPFVLTTMSLGVAVPFVLMTLGRTKRQMERVSRHVPSRSASGVFTQPAPRQKRPHKAAWWTVAVTNTVEVLLAFFCAISPVVLMFLTYYFVFSTYTPWLVDAAESLLPYVGMLIAGALVLSLIPYIWKVGVPGIVITVRFTVVTWFLYALPVAAGLVLFLPVILVPRLSTRYLAGATLLLTILGSYRNVRLLLRFGVYASIGYMSYQKYLVVEAHPAEPWVWCRVGIVHALDCVLLGFWLWYLPTYEDKPYHTGKQRSRWFTAFARKYLFSDAVRYYNFRVIKDDETMTMKDGKQQYFFSFHPHGVFPGTALFCTLTQEWREQMSNNDSNYVSTHVASIIFNVPIVRDFNLRVGSLSVSRRTLEGSLKRGNSVVVVTGGQAEMLHTDVSDKSMTLVTQHKGFVRLAMAQKVRLVPLLCFAENNVLSLLRFPRIQRIALKILGFPFPMIPHGRFGLPLPRRTPLTLVVGTPIEIPADADPENPADVDALSAKYFAEVKDLFYRHRAAAGYPEMELKLVDDKAEREKARLAKEAKAAGHTTEDLAKKQQ